MEMLILEGANFLGKTTAAKRLVELAAERAARGVKLEAPLEICDWVLPVRYCHATRPNLAFDFFGDYRDMISIYAVQDRFHLGALAYHEDKIDAEQMCVLEAWLGNVGSYTVVFVTTERDWYKERLENARKPVPNLAETVFSVERLMQANEIFYDIASENYQYPVKVDRTLFIAPDKFPDDDVLNSILDSWYKRVALVIGG